MSCAGEAKDLLTISATIHSLQPPTGNAIQYLCSQATLADMNVSGTEIQWYADKMGGSPLESSTVLIDGTHYYASQSVGGCESQSRLDTEVVLKMVTPPVGDTTQTFCAGAEITDLHVTGIDVRWYASSSDSAPLDASEALINNTVYYGAQLIDGGESFERLSVNVVVNEATPSPISEIVTQSFCTSATLTDIQATGSSIQYYSSQENGSPLPVNQIVENDSSYYLTQTVNGCESTARLEIKTIVNTTPPPDADAFQTFCNEAKISALAATGSDVKWYDQAVEGSPVNDSTDLINNSQYYASQTINGCESSTRREITAQITMPGIPYGETLQTLDSGKTVSDLVVMGEGIQWYSSAIDAINTTNALDADTPVEDQHRYYCVETIDGCSGLESLPVTVSMPIPDVDLESPSITTTIPVSGSIKVNPTADLQITFNEIVKAGTGNITIHNSETGSALATIDASSAQVIVMNQQVQIKLSSPLPYSLQLYVTIDEGAFTDVPGNIFHGLPGTSWNFETDTQVIDTALTDKAPPVVISTLPENDAVDVNTNTTLTIEFNEEVLLNEGSIALEDESHDTISTLEITSSNTAIVGKTVTISLPELLPSNKTISVQLPPGSFKDIAGNAFEGGRSMAVFNSETHYVS
jgi:methionine-rich copper-binding protein CopC